MPTQEDWIYIMGPGGWKPVGPASTVDITVDDGVPWKKDTPP